MIAVGLWVKTRAVGAFFVGFLLFLRLVPQVVSECARARVWGWIPGWFAHA